MLLPYKIGLGNVPGVLRSRCLGIVLFQRQFCIQPSHQTPGLGLPATLELFLPIVSSLRLSKLVSESKANALKLPTVGWVTIAFFLGLGLNARLKNVLSTMRAL